MRLVFSYLFFCLDALSSDVSGLLNFPHYFCAIVNFSFLWLLKFALYSEVRLYCVQKYLEFFWFFGVFVCVYFISLFVCLVGFRATLAVYGNSQVLLNQS